jgi:ubiquinone biosynthesis protein COQ4
VKGGRRLLQAKPDIVSKLNDRAWLLSLPEGSVGRTYYDFVHGENLSADGLISSSDGGFSLLRLTADCLTTRFG